MNRLRWVAVAAMVLSARVASAQFADCSVRGQNTFVHDTLTDIYFWYRELPPVDPGVYPSPEAYLEAVRYRPLDTTFSFVADRQQDNAFFSDSQFVGFGFRTALRDGRLRVAQVFPDSPSAVAGFERGADILAIDGTDLADIVDLNAALGPAQPGITRVFRFRTLDGRVHEETLVKGVVTIPTVSAVRVYQVGERRIGYLGFENFVTPSDAALDVAFAQLAALGARDLVLDMRYNGGGLLSVAQHLASLIAGQAVVSRPFAFLVHNDRHRELDTSFAFQSTGNALDLERLVVITTKSTASASELVINGLRPYIPVIEVGSTTYGKPVGQYGYTFCDKVLHPVAFSVTNAAGQGDYFEGIAPDCAAGDDIEHALGDPAESSLAESIGWLQTGACGAAAQAPHTVRPLSAARPVSRDGWRVLLGGAY